MASSARIDELRKKFDENPRRYFAPLANEYRKAGDLEQAIFICQEYLPQQPGHMSGHIVYGQALFELNRHDEAKTVFETALSLDPENLIALRHLGDIARLAGDTNSARIWYQRVLEADPRNEEIAQMMLELLNAGGAPTPLSSPAVSAPAADIAPDLESHVGSDLAEPMEPATISDPAPAAFEVEKATDVAMEIPSPVAPPPPPPAQAAEEAAGEPAGEAAEHDDGLLDLGSFDLGGEPASAASAPSAPASNEPEEPFEEDPFAIAAAPQPEIELATDMSLGLPDDSPPAVVEAEAPSGLQTFEAGKMSHTPPVAASAIETESFFDLPMAEPEPVVASTPAPAPVPEPEPEAEPEPAAPFVTETMATLYLEQGHLESAIEIYQQLIAQRPDDMALRERLRAVEERLHGPTAPLAPAAPAAQSPAYGGPTIRDFLSGLISRTPISVQEIPAPTDADTQSGVELSATTDAKAEPATPPVPERRPTPSSVETVSGSLGALFSSADATASDTAAASTLAEAFQPEGPGTAPLEGVPAHRASSELSLDHVFKSGGPQRREEGGEDFSFDQFFAEEAAESDANPDASTAPASEGGDDIAQFNAWLNGLKKT